MDLDIIEQSTDTSFNPCRFFPPQITLPRAPPVRLFSTFNAEIKLHKLLFPFFPSIFLATLNNININASKCQRDTKQIYAVCNKLNWLSPCLGSVNSISRVFQDVVRPRRRRSEEN